MNRREFLTSIGAGLGTLLLTPQATYAQPRPQRYRFAAHIQLPCTLLTSGLTVAHIAKTFLESVDPQDILESEVEFKKTSEELYECQVSIYTTENGLRNWSREGSTRDEIPNARWTEISIPSLSSNNPREEALRSGREVIRQALEEFPNGRVEAQGLYPRTHPDGREYWTFGFSFVCPYEEFINASRFIADPYNQATDLGGTYDFRKQLPEMKWK